jgi:hypothetical protein
VFSLTAKTYNLKAHEGQGALALAFLVGGTAILAALALAFFAASFTNTIYGFQAANRALAAASSGVSDAVRELARDKAFLPNPPLGTYTIPDVGGIPVTVTVENPISGQPGFVRIRAEASSFGFVRNVEAVVSVHQRTGEVVVLSWQLVT